MSTKSLKSRRLGFVFILAITTALWIGVMGSGQQASAGVPTSQPLSKVEQGVLDKTANSMSTSFIALFKGTAELNKAYSIRDEDQRGWFVYNTLKQHADTSQASVRNMLSLKGIQFQSFWVANAIVLTGDRSLVENIAARPEVISIEANGVFRGLDNLVNPQSPSVIDNNNPETIEWNITNINAPQVWAMGFTGQGIVISNQDTGMRWTHNAIKAHYRGWDGTTADHNFNWWDGVRGPVPGHTTNPCGYAINAPCDDYGHGTHTTGTTNGDDGAGNQVGVAPGSKWIGCRNMDAGDGRPITYMSCFQWLVAPTDLAGNNANPALRPHVMNNSWGCPTVEECAANTLQASVEAAQAAGIFVEASAGNSGPSCSTVTDPPAIYGASFSTGAIDSSNALVGFSSRGPVTVDGSNRMKPEISAPGSGVRSSYSSSDSAYSVSSGTSMAGPHVVGAVALLWSARPWLSRQITETKTLLEQTANPNVTVNPVQTCGGIPSSTIPNNSFGYGRLDILAAVNASGATPTPTRTGTPPTAIPTSTVTGTPPTSTPTPTPIVVGHVIWQGRPNQPNALQQLPISLTLKSSAGETDYPMQTTDANGFFTDSVTGLSNGLYQWRVKNPKYLAITGTITLSGASVTNAEMGAMLAGDCDDDNSVGLSDFTLLKTTFGKSLGQSGYDDRAEYDGDDTVGLSDFTLLKSNFGNVGPLPIRAESP